MSGSQNDKKAISLDDDMLSVSDGFPENEQTPTNRGTQDSSHHTGETPDPKRTRQEGREEQATQGSAGVGGPEAGTPARGSQEVEPNLTVPTQPTQGQGPAQPNPANLTLADLFQHMQTGFQTVGNQVTSIKAEIKEDLGRDINRIRNEQKETNTIAAKALTTADQTKNELKTLAQRVDKLERGGGPPGLVQGPHQTPSGPKGKGKHATGYEQLGGDHGNEVIVGQIPTGHPKKSD